MPMPSRSVSRLSRFAVMGCLPPLVAPRAPAAFVAASAAACAASSSWRESYPRRWMRSSSSFARRSASSKLTVPPFLTPSLPRPATAPAPPAAPVLVRVPRPLGRLVEVVETLVAVRSDDELIVRDWAGTAAAVGAGVAVGLGTCGEAGRELVGVARGERPSVCSGAGASVGAFGTGLESQVSKKSPTGAAASAAAFAPGPAPSMKTLPLPNLASSSAMRFWSSSR